MILRGTDSVFCVCVVGHLLRIRRIKKESEKEWCCLKRVRSPALSIGWCRQVWPGVCLCLNLWRGWVNSSQPTAPCFGLTFSAWFALQNDPKSVFILIRARKWIAKKQGIFFLIILQNLNVVYQVSSAVAEVYFRHRSARVSLFLHMFHVCLSMCSVHSARLSEITLTEEKSSKIFNLKVD